MSVRKINLTYNYQKYEVEVDTSDSVEVLKFQIFSVTNLEPEKQKIVGFKGGILKDDADLSKLDIKDGQKIMLFEINKSENQKPAQNSVPEPTVFKEDIESWQTCCSSVFIPEPVTQPTFKLNSNGSSICYACATTCHLSNVVSPAHDSKPFTCECNRNTCLFSPRRGGGLEVVTGKLKAMMQDSLKIAFDQQQSQMKIIQSPQVADGRNTMIKKVESMSKHVLCYHDPKLQQKAREIIPVETLRERAIAQINSNNNSNGKIDDLVLSDEILKQLLHWFKAEFFTWVDKPPCDICKGPTASVGMGPPMDSELMYGAGRVELYKCDLCSVITRFPRYNDPGKLLETRRGRCGEWANCFTACCIALGYDARYILDFTDHVWTEVWTGAGRFVHLDPCEDTMDSPLMYEAGWGKKLSYVFAFSEYEAVDVTKRYTASWDELKTRRTICDEEWLQDFMRDFSEKRQKQLLQHNKMSPSRIDEIRTRRQKEDQELEAALHAAKMLKEEEKKGRISGAQEWKEQRGEVGNPNCNNKDDDKCATTVTDTARVPVTFAENSNEDPTLNPWKSLQFTQVMNFVSGKDGNSPEFSFVGTAKLLKNNQQNTTTGIRLTERKNSQIGAAWYQKRVNIKNGFVCKFRFQIVDATNPGADGFAWVIQNHGLSALGTDGCQMGFGGIPKSLAVEFDTYQSVDRTLDPNNHISIQTRGKEPNNAMHLYSLGCNVNIGAILNDGKPHTVRLSYVNNTLRVFLDDLTRAILKVDNVKLSELLGLGENEDGVFFGFTAATGGLSQCHDILDCEIHTM